MTKKEQAKLARVPSASEVASLVSDEVKEAKELEEFLGGFSIDSQSELDFAAEALQKVAEKHDVLDAKRKSWVNPLNRVVKDINSTFKPVLDLLKKAETGLKGKIGDYHVKAERERIRLLEKAGSASKRNPAKADRLIEEAELLDVDKVEGLGIKMVWTGAVVDPKAIPREYLMPDVKKLLAVTQASATDPEIPGWRAWQVSQIRTRRSS